MVEKEVEQNASKGEIPTFQEHDKRFWSYRGRVKV